MEGLGEGWERGGGIGRQQMEWAKERRTEGIR